MFEKCVRVSVVAGLLTFCGVAAVAAQGTPAAPARDVMAELLAEVRGLRAEMRAASDATIRTQLLVARLQLQEQRINSLSRQLADVQRQIADNERGRAPLAAQVKMMLGDDSVPAAEKDGREVVVGPLKNILDQLDKSDRDLKVQEASLMGLIAEEQARWVSFNASLDELARQIETRGK
jgi:hypothetical protein